MDPKIFCCPNLVRKSEARSPCLVPLSRKKQHMRLNYEIAILGRYCILVPYRKEHVAKYHEWMKDPQLLESTGSEPLSLEGEYEMQASWRDDEFKCTFIILDRKSVDEKLLETAAKAATTSDCYGDAPALVQVDFILETLSAMVGDVNLFFSELDDQGDDDYDAAAQITPAIRSTRRTIAMHESAATKPLQAEIDIMVAEPASRNKGIGREAVVLMMQYARDNLPVRRFFCKINQENVASRTLFNTKLGFRQCDYAECFKQYEYELRYDHEHGWDTGDAFLDERAAPLQILQCPVSNEE